VIFLRCFVCVLLALASANAFGANFKFRGMPSRQIVIVQHLPGPATTYSQLPAPTAPGLGTGAQVAKEEPLADQPSKAEPPTDPGDAAKKAKLKIAHDRLNHNTLLWQIERAEAGSAVAMRSLGMRFLTGDGLEKDETKAREWLEKGAKGGDPAAKKELAKLDAPKSDTK
jgi:hypothetical protein